jgi:predicted nucleotidyltransferase component of viral defense system
MQPGDLVLKPPQFDRPGSWQALFNNALKLTDHLASVTTKPVWSFGGGTVLMLRLNHRHSKDIDLFVPEPQYLGFVSPRLADAAEELTTQYEEGAEYTKLFFPEGEIDFVVGTPLTDSPWDVVQHRGRDIRVESCAEIVAKKMYYRGNQAKARDLFDICAVQELEPAAIEVARPFMHRHKDAFLERLTAHLDLAKEEFNRIERIAYTRSFEECIRLAKRVFA